MAVWRANGKQSTSIQGEILLFPGILSDEFFQPVLHPTPQPSMDRNCLWVVGGWQRRGGRGLRSRREKAPKMIKLEGSQGSDLWLQTGQVVPTHVQPRGPVTPGAVSLSRGEVPHQRFPGPPLPGTLRELLSDFTAQRLDSPIHHLGQGHPPLQSRSCSKYHCSCVLIQSVSVGQTPGRRTLGQRALH